MRVEMEGFKEQAEKIGKIPEGLDTTLEDFLNEVGEDWLSDTKANTPVDSGELRRSMTFEGAKKSAGGFEIAVSNTLSYSEHVEYGHRTRGGKGYVPGVHMMRDGQKDAEQTISKELGSLISEVEDEYSDN
nr:MAG TPA: type I neck protein [Caudoviricetes sp.]